MRTDAARAVHTPKHLLATLTAESWELQADCRGPMAYWWDDHLDGAHSETPGARRARHARAIEVCHTCPVRSFCEDAVTPAASGIWAGRLVTGERCQDCNRPMYRSRNDRSPGAVRHRAGGLCGSCVRRSRRMMARKKCPLTC